MASDVFEVDWIAIGRAAPSASSRALSSLDSKVIQQGAKIESEAKRTDGLYTSIGDTNAAIQNEAKARSDADGSLSQQIQNTQSSIGETNAAVQQVSRAQTQLNGKVNASYSVKLQVTAGGQYVAAGFGLGVENSGGVLQSTFAVMADKFAILNPSGNGFVNPFSIQGGQVFINDALISKLSVQNAIVGSTISSSIFTQFGEPLMTVDFNSGEIILRNFSRRSTYTKINNDGIDVVVDGVRRFRAGVW
nr:DUF1983 domain-containing protein [Pseudomonas parafulva]